MYYSGESREFEPHHCVGVAISESENPKGPYIPQEHPLVCQMEYGGAIDPSPFRDSDGTHYVVYKADGNSIGRGGNCNNGVDPKMPTPLMLQKLDADAVTPIEHPVGVLDRDKEDGPLVEAPNIIKSKHGIYFLFYSSHCFDSKKYDVKYATARNIMGPYIRAPRPLLRTGDFGLRSPGGATVSQDGTRIVFHANCGSHRCMWAGGVAINGTNLDFASL